MSNKYGVSCNQNNYDSTVAIKDYSWLAGDTNYIEIRILDSDGVVVPALSGIVQLRQTVNGSVVVQKAATIDVETGIITFKFDPVDTEGLVLDAKPIDYLYDTELVMENGDTMTPIAGKIRLKKSITRI